MPELRKLARATISRFLRKCCSLRRSERRAPSIPRALKRNEKHASISSENSFFSQLPEGRHGKPLRGTLQTRRASRRAYKRVNTIVTREFRSLRSQWFWQYKNRKILALKHKLHRKKSRFAFT